MGEFVCAGGMVNMPGGEAIPTLGVTMAKSINFENMMVNAGFYVMMLYVAGLGVAFLVSIVDTDGDTLCDWTEVVSTHTDPSRADTDGDGAKDGWEVDLSHTNPLNPDTDGDGLTDRQEDAPLVWWAAREWGLPVCESTDPLNPDTDGDGIPDGEEKDRCRPR